MQSTRRFGGPLGAEGLEGSKVRGVGEVGQDTFLTPSLLELPVFYTSLRRYLDRARAHSAQIEGQPVAGAKGAYTRAETPSESASRSETC